MVAGLQTPGIRARTELLALLQDAREHPGDLTPRLVLADWLEDFGEPADCARAELIRLQCRLESHDSAGGRFSEVAPAVDREQASLLRQQEQLLATHEQAWLGPLADLALSWEFHRGLVVLELDVSRLQRRALLALAGGEPWAWVEGVRLQGGTGRQLACLSDCPPLESITTLQLTGDLRRAEARSLLRMGWFAGLRQLDLAQSYLAEEALALFAGAPGVPVLDRLSLFQSGLTPRGLQALLHSGVLAGVDALDLRHNRLGDAAVEALARSPRVGRPSHLLLGGNRVGPRGCRALARSTLLANLRWLDLVRNPLGDDGARALAGAPGLGRLTHLHLGQSQLGAGGARAVIHSPHLERLTDLRLDHNEIDDLSFLREKPFSPALRELVLTGNPLAPTALFTLARTTPPPSLTALALGNCSLTAGELEALAAGGWLNRLTRLDLSGNDLGSDQLRTLAARAPRLDSLRLAGCRVDDEAVATLPGPAGLSRLSCLDLADNQIGAEGVEVLASPGAFPGLTVLNLDGNSLGDNAVLNLVNSPALGRPAMLSLRECGLTDAGVAALARSPALARISRLALAGPEIGPASAHALLTSPHTRALRLLVLKAPLTDPRLRRDLCRRFPCCILPWPSD